jgi:hypothetical protein
MQQEGQSQLFSDLDMDPVAKIHIRSLASWAMVIVVVAVIRYAISILRIFMVKEEKAVQLEGFDLSITMGASGPAGSIITILIGLLINYFLFRFASQARTAIDGLNQQQLNSSFNNLKVYFMATSIIMIIAFALILLSVFIISSGTR